MSELFNKLDTIQWHIRPSERYLVDDAFRDSTIPSEVRNKIVIVEDQEESRRQIA